MKKRRLIGCFQPVQRKIGNFDAQAPQMKMKTADFHSRASGLFQAAKQRAASPPLDHTCPDNDDHSEYEQSPQHERSC
jgi:hypothetical protein